MATTLGRAAYGRVSDTTPVTRAWDGTNFGSETDLNLANSDVLWMVVKSNPANSAEKCVAFWADNLTGDNFWVMVWNGSSWSTGFSGRFAESQTSRGFDLEYENKTLSQKHRGFHKLNGTRILRHLSLQRSEKVNLVYVRDKLSSLRPDQ